MNNNTKLFKFVKDRNYSSDNIDFLVENTNFTYKQLIREYFEMLNYCIKRYDKTDFANEIIHNIVELILILCSMEKFDDNEIETNKARIKKSRDLLYPYLNESNLILKSINLLDEIVLEKNIDPNLLTELIIKLIDKQEDVNIIKKIANLNKVVKTNDTVLFDYAFDKAIAALEENNRDIYYYITLLKIFYNSKVNKNNYTSRIYAFRNNIFVNEIKCILSGNKRPYDGEKVLQKYEISDSQPSIIIRSQYNSFPKKNIITIDNASTLLRDDAISIKKDGNKYVVSIYITDLSSIIKRGSDVDLQALKNFKSIYLPQRKIPMLNERVENKISLNKNRVRNVYVLDVFMNDSGDIIDYRIRLDTITVCDNLSYEYADKVLSVSKKDSPYYFLHTLEALAQALSNKNKNKIKYWELKDNSDSDCKRTSYNSEKIISEFMILYNRIMSEFARDHNYVYIYRGKDKEYMSKMIEDLGIQMNDKTKRTISAIYLDSKYSITPIPHTGLGYECYSHSSNPGREYVSMYNQYLFKKFHFCGKNDVDSKELEGLIEYFNKREREIALLTAEYTRSLRLKK